jgi:hypothetical protein
MTDTTHEAPDLLPCPFCGGGITSIEGKGQIWRGVRGYSDPQYYQLNHFGKLSETDDFPRCSIEFRCRTEAEAIAAWNTRSDDLVQAAVAGALTKAADAIADYPRVAPDATEAQHYDEQIEYCQSIILALITPDAQAALDRVVAEQREKDAKVAFDAGCGWQALRTAALSSSWPEDAAKHLASEHAAFAIAAAIREGSNERSEEGK